MGHGGWSGGRREGWTGRMQGRAAEEAARHPTFLHRWSPTLTSASQVVHSVCLSKICVCGFLRCLDLRVFCLFCVRNLWVFCNFSNHQKGFWCVRERREKPRTQMIFVFTFTMLKPNKYGRYGGYQNMRGRGTLVDKEMLVYKYVNPQCLGETLPLLS